MKKFILSCAAAVAMFAMVSCSSPKDKTLSIYKDATEQLKEAKGDKEKSQKIVDETMDKFQDLLKEMEPSEIAEVTSDAEVQKATEEYTNAVMESGVVPKAITDMAKSAGLDMNAMPGGN